MLRMLSSFAALLLSLEETLGGFAERQDSCRRRRAPHRQRVDRRFPVEHLPALFGPPASVLERNAALASLAEPRRALLPVPSIDERPGAGAGLLDVQIQIGAIAIRGAAG